MDIQAEKLELMEILLHTESKTVLEKLRTVFNSEKEKYHQGEGINYSWEEAKKIIRGK